MAYTIIFIVSGYIRTLLFWNCVLVLVTASIRVPLTVTAQCLLSEEGWCFQIDESGAVYFRLCGKHSI